MTSVDPAPLELADPLAGLEREQLELMLAAGYEARECMRVLHKVGRNLVGEILEGQGEFVQYQHYPKGDVYDPETHSQYYYHAHRPGEHGHFHLFLRAAGMPEGIAPAPYDGDAPRPLGRDAVAHLIAISMDAWGRPIALFTTNRWVTAETWYRAEDVVRMLDRFEIDHAWPSWPTNRWLGAMVRLFRPQIIQLLHARDRAVAAWQARHPERDVYEDRELEVTSWLPISLEEQIRAVEAHLGLR